MKIAFLQSETVRAMVFNDKHLAQLRQLGEVVMPIASDKLAPSQVAEQIAGADIAITCWGTPRLGEEILAAAPDLSLILHAAGTVKSIIDPVLWSRGVRVTSARDALGKGVAETTLGLTIASLKNMWRLSAQLRHGGWRPDDYGVRELYEVTIGVIGGGGSGRHYMRLLKQFDVEVILYDPYVSSERAEEMGARKVELDELLERSDVISVHAPSIPETYRMLSRKQFTAMKDDCILINTARGSLIDEQALAQELQKGRLFACIDVTDPEPPAEDHPFRTLPNVVMTPHIAGAINNGMHRMGQYIVDDIRNFCEGKPLHGEIMANQLSILA